MSRIDLNTNRNSLSSAHSEICDPHSPNNWVIFGYDGKTNVLKVVEKGDGGIEELVDEVNSGRIQYIWIRVQDPNTALPKFVLVNWQGEGVQEIRKGNCVNHFRDVENFFRGAHVTIQARSEDDLDESEIMDKVAKSSGSNYSFHKEKARPIEEPKPVGSVYQKTRPTININVRDQFWEKTQEEEQRRVEEEKQNRQAIAQKMERERKEREAAEQAERDRKESERMKKIIEIKHAEKRANSENKEKIKEQWEQQQSDAIREEQERKKRSEQMRKQRSAEAAALVGKRAMNPKSVFQQNNESQFDKPTTAPSRKLKSTFLEHDDSTPATRKQPIQLPTVDPGNAAELENTPAESENSMTSGKPRRPQPSKLAANRFLSRDEDEQPSYTRKQPIQLPTEDPGNAAELESEPTQSEADYEEQEQPYRPPARPGKLPPNRVAVMPTTQQQMVDEEEERRLAEERQMEEQRRQEEAMREEQMRQEQIRQQQEAARTSMGGTGDGASLMKQGLPRRQADSDEEPADDDAWGDDDEPSLPQAVIASPLADDTQVLYDDATHVTHDDPQALYDDATHVAKDDQQELYDDATHVARDDQQALYDDATHVARDDQQTLYDDVNTSAKSNLRAKALYDYQAADDTEITFDPDDIITNVEQIDDGWWTGTAPNGDHGMFPANYVELI